MTDKPCGEAATGSPRPSQDQPDTRLKRRPRVEPGDYVDIDELVAAMRSEGLNADYENLRIWSIGFLAAVTVDGHEIGLIEGSELGHLVLEWNEDVPEGMPRP